MTKSIEMERPLPHNPEAERIILGAILVGHKNRAYLLDQVQPGDFFLTQHVVIVRAFGRLHEQGQPVDALTVFDELVRENELIQAGGAAYLAELGDHMPMALNLEHHLASLKNLARMRAIARAASGILDKALEGLGDANAVWDSAIEDLSAIERGADTDANDTVSYRSAGLSLLNNLEKRDALRIFTGLQGLDELTGGFRAGELVIFTGGTGHGKTLLVQQTRHWSCESGYHSLFCSGEMLAPSLVSREIAAAAGVKPWKMRVSERLTDEDWKALTYASSHLCPRCQIMDRELSLRGIRRSARRLKGGEGLELLIVDYDELVEAPGKDEFEQQRTIVRGLKSLAMEIGCAAILVSQLRKPLTGEDAKRPTLHGLYGSGAKSKHASCACFVDRPFVRELKGDEAEARVVVLKHRDGRVGRVEAMFNIETLRFETPCSKAI